MIALLIVFAAGAAHGADVSDWAGLERACASSGTVTLSSSFTMGSSMKTIDFSGKVIVIKGNNAILHGDGVDCGGHNTPWSCRFFRGDGSGPGNTSLELHDLHMQNATFNIPYERVPHANCPHANCTGGAIYATDGAEVTIFTSKLSGNRGNRGGGPFREPSWRESVIVGRESRIGLHTWTVNV